MSHDVRKRLEKLKINNSLTPVIENNSEDICSFVEIIYLHRPVEMKVLYIATLIFLSDINLIINLKRTRP